MNDNQSNAPVDWTQFRDGDRVRVTYEGTWRRDYLAVNGHNLHLDEALQLATSAELIERPFTPPAPGTLFRHSDGRLFQALSAERFMVVRWADGEPSIGACYAWAESDPAWRDAIEVLDI